MRNNIDDIRSKALPVLKEAGVIRCAIFGSYARGDNKKDSDIDILVELPEDKSLLDLVGLKMDLEQALKKKVDLISYNGIHPMLKQSILLNQVSIL